MSSPLNNLQQQVYDARGGANTRYLVCTSASRDTSSRWAVTVWAHDQSPGGTIPRLWTSPEEQVDADAQEIADAIRAGMLSVQPTEDDGLKLLVHVASGRVSRHLTPSDSTSHAHVDRLLGVAFNLVTRPEDRAVQSNARLTAQLEERDAEIASLNNKILNIKATIQRHTGSAGRKDLQSSPVKQAAPPANASKLQPNQKRRKLVETEFAGSDESDDDDDDEESEEEYDE